MAMVGLAAAVLIVGAATAAAVEVSFQNGVDGYTGGQDSFLQRIAADVNDNDGAVAYQNLGNPRAANVTNDNE